MAIVALRAVLEAAARVMSSRGDADGCLSAVIRAMPVGAGHPTSFNPDVECSHG